jgi:sporulation protein YlmC with PRC-barrel domain
MNCAKNAPVAQRPASHALLAVCCYLGLMTALLASQPADAASNEKTARKCLRDLRSFDSLLQKDGYWLHGSGYGYDYPMNAHDLGGPGTKLSGSSAQADAYWHVRPGYEVRTLMAAANVLARRGQQQSCEALLSTTRDLYNNYAASLRDGEAPPADKLNRQSRQIAGAQSVSAFDDAFRSSHLIGTDVSNPSNQDLGSVMDVILSPRTGKIAYLLIGRGGLFGIDEKYVPVPWKDFKIPPDTTLLVLNTSEHALDAAPQVQEDQFATQGDYGAKNQAVDDYWKARLSQ